MYWNEYKTKSENKNTTNKYIFESNFVGVNRLFLLIYSNQQNNSERYKAKKYYLIKGIIKNYNVIIIGNNFYDQPKNKKGQGEGYTTGCFLNYEYIKNHYRLITIELSRQKN